MSKKTEPKPIYIIEGYKGGVGKSLVSVSLIEYHRMHNIPVAIVETDTTNPDVDAIYDGKESCLRIDLDEKDGGGWMNLADFADEHLEAIIISMKAGSKASTVKNQEILIQILKDLKRPVVLFFVLGIQKQSVVLFNDAMDLYPMASCVVAVKNLKNGDEDEFFNYDKIRESPLWAEKFKDVIDFTFPRVHARVSLQITDEDMTIKELLEGDTLKRGDRAALQAWTGKIFGFYDANREQLGV